MATTINAVVSLEEASGEPVGVQHPVSPAVRPLSLKRNAIWTTLGNGTYAAAQWAQIAIIARLGSSADVGRYALALAVCAPIFMLTNLQLRQIQATDTAQKNTFADYLGLRLVCSAGAIMATSILAFFSSASGPVVVLTLLVGVFKAVESISDIYQGLLQQHERMDYVGRSLLLKSALMFSAFGGTYYATKSLVLAVSAMICAQVAGCLAYDVRASYLTAHSGAAASWRHIVRVMWAVSFSPAQLKPLAIRAFPLGITMMLLSLYANLPRLLLNKYVGPAGVGVFAAIGYVFSCGTLLVTAVGTAVAPRLAKNAYHDRRSYNRLLTRLSLFAGSLGIAGLFVALLFGRRLLGFLYGSEYARHLDVLIWAAVAGTFTYVASSLGFGATALGRFREQPWAVAFATGILLSSSLILIPGYGLPGAAMSTAAASCAYLLSYIFIVARKTHAII